MTSYSKFIPPEAGESVWRYFYSGDVFLRLDPSREHCIQRPRNRAVLGHCQHRGHRRRADILGMRDECVRGLPSLSDRRLLLLTYCFGFVITRTRTTAAAALLHNPYSNSSSDVQHNEDIQSTHHTAPRRPWVQQQSNYNISTRSRNIAV